MTATGVYKKTMNSAINGINGEVLGIPRQLARVRCGRSHTYYEVSRKWEAYEEQKRLAVEQPVDGQQAHAVLDVMARQGLRRSLIDAYTHIAKVIHDLHDGKDVTPEYLLGGEQFIQERRYEHHTYDEVSEGGRA